GHDVVEAVVREAEVQGVPLLEADVTPAGRVDLVLRALEHVGCEIDARHVAVRRIRIERETGADAELEHPRGGLDVERADDARDPRVEDAAEDQIIQMRELVVETALMRLRVHPGHAPPPCQSVCGRRNPRRRPYRPPKPACTAITRRWSLAAAA